ncbi:ATP-binding cassette sub-family B member 10, mitochondrial [Neodiprion pinetum]|uniref:ATP-binding cassette sub-family B member 10, mitochondrial n=1 Tax=Neodiprion lecontei TaxID=441921 RepID=A0A6J0CA73_NEOLC|nr:ATP-binding cassette sub-family B member 10, mitochondrial [Neodiprion lecontei]XP_046486910.1 ATP-binding cassette sub-family B member 10, mitochondrial [Neodiprion pinetum]
MILLNKIICNRNVLRKSNYLYLNWYRKCCFHSHLQTKLLQKKKCILTIFKRETANALGTGTVRSQMKTATKKNLRKSELKRLFNLAEPEKFRLLGAIGLLIVSSTVTMAVPFCLGKIIDLMYAADKEKMKENLNKLSLTLLGVFLIGGVCNFGRVYLMSTTGHRITQSLRKKVFTAIVSQETAMFDKRSTGELVGRLSGDAQLVSSAVTTNISDGLRSSIMTIAGVSMMVYMSPELALVGLSTVPPVVGLAIMYGRFVKKISRQVQDSLASLNVIAEERISNIRTVKAFAQEVNEIKKYSIKLDDLLKLCYKESFYKGVFFGMTGLSGNAIILSVLYYGGGMVSDSSLTVGNLSAFLLYAAYIGLSLGGLSNFYSELNKALGASTRLFELIEREPKISIHGGRVLPQKLSGNVIFDNVTFSYPTRLESQILSDLTLGVEKCSITAIVGPSGSGKSTIAALLLRLYDPNGGRILLDGEDLKELDPTWVKSQIGYVSQEPTLFSSSIRENITYGVANSTETEVMDAASQANILEFTQGMKDGLDTIVGERGVTLSGGQRQRIAIARALIKNPKILILDEATSALDAQNERLVQEALERATQGRTVLTIAHRLSTIKNSDKIAVLDHGRVVEIGNYDHLMTIENGLFRNLVKHQTFT